MIVNKKRITHIRNKYSYLIIPILITIALLLLDCIFPDIFIIESGKTDVIVSLSSVFIGFLLTVFTIYITFPKDSEVMDRIIKSGHDRVLKQNIITGIILFLSSIIIWLFNIGDTFIIYSFVAGIGNFCVTFEYIYKISKKL